MGRFSAITLKVALVLGVISLGQSSLHAQFTFTGTELPNFKGTRFGPQNNPVLADQGKLRPIQAGQVALDVTSGGKSGGGTTTVKTSGPTAGDVATSIFNAANPPSPFGLRGATPNVRNNTSAPPAKNTVLLGSIRQGQALSQPSAARPAAPVSTANRPTSPVTKPRVR